MEKLPYRSIIHIDMDAFYASVEQRDRPELRGRPIAVGRGEGRSVVATASYEARAFGVHSAMPSFQAKELCPELVFVPADMERYKAVSREVRAIFRRHTDLVEPLSIDEAFLDVSAAAGPDGGREIAIAIKREIRSELSLTASAGVSYNKFLAKVASDWKKPDGLFCIPPADALAFIAALPVEKFWGVGPVTAERMHRAGIRTGLDLRRVPLPELKRRFGSAGELYYSFARGIDRRRVTPTHRRKSVGAESTLERNARTFDEAVRALAPIERSLYRRLARNQFLGVTLVLKLKYADFRQVTRSRTVSRPLQDPAEIHRIALELLAAAEIPATGVRLIGLSVTGPEEPGDAAQGELDF